MCFVINILYNQSKPGKKGLYLYISIKEVGIFLTLAGVLKILSPCLIYEIVRS